MNDFSDDILVAASQRGDKSAYALLVKRHYRHVFAMCLGLVANVHDAEDIAQDAVLKGFLKIRELRENEQFVRWILRIAKNLSIDFARRKKYARAFLGKQPVQQRETMSENDDLQQAIGRLPEKFRLPLLMYYFDNKNAKAIAEKLNISHSGVCQRIRAAKKQLHELLTEGRHNEE